MRINLSTHLKTRTGAPDKDARLKNAYIEVKGDQSVVRKRPCAQGGVETGTGTAQGGIEVVVGGIGYIYSVYGDAGSVSGDNWRYANDGSNLPATVDLGALEYQGPSETPLTAPADTVTYNNVGQTIDGRVVRKVTTKTYSTGSSAGSNTTAYPNALDYPYGVKLKPSYGISTVYANGQAGADAALAYTNAYLSSVGSPYYPIDYYSNSVSSSTSWNFLGFKSGQGYLGYDGTIVLATNYFVYIHEVWTYEIVG